MRKKELRLVATFHTTDAAIAAEHRCKKAGLSGKLITVPRSITSDCGIAWSAPIALRQETILALEGIKTAGFYELVL